MRNILQALHESELILNEQNTCNFYKFSVNAAFIDFCLNSIFHFHSFRKAKSYVNYYIFCLFKGLESEIIIIINESLQKSNLLYCPKLICCNIFVLCCTFVFGTQRLSTNSFSLENYAKRSGQCYCVKEYQILKKGIRYQHLKQNE